METKIEGVTLGVIPGTADTGGCLKGEIEASFTDLVALLGPPNTSGDGHKVSTEWTVTHAGRVWRLYDYKETSTYSDDLPSVEEFRALPTYAWHVGGNGDASAFTEVVGRAIAKLHR